MINVNDKSFQEKVLEQSKTKPVIVDFYADWCGACNVLMPVMENVEKKYKNKIIIVKANVDESQVTARLYDVMGIPAVKFIRNKKVVDEFVGSMPEAKVIEWIEKNL